MKVFGSHYWHIIPKSKLKKLDARAREAIMVGYSEQSRGYKLWDAKTKTFVVSRDVIFKEESENENTYRVSPKKMNEK